MLESIAPSPAAASDALTQPIGILTEHDFMVEAVRRYAFENDKEFARFHHGASDLIESRTLDYLFATSHEPHDPQLVFERLRWGGQFVFASRHAREAEAVAKEYAAMGFVIERGPERVHRWLLGIPLIRMGPRVYFFVARKILLIPPHEFNHRFTYDVRLERRGSEYVVAKRIPDLRTIVERLSKREGSAGDNGSIEQQAQQLAEKVLPIFLTREAAFLQILQRDLPPEAAARVPRALSVTKNKQGMVTKLQLNWLRKTDRTMSQIDFALQSAALLSDLHRAARVIHMDLRLDNFVITDDGVGFVDFGSAARAGENVASSPLLHQLFGRLMKTSQVQQVLEHMTARGRVTSRYLTCARHRVDRAVDLFSLVAQLDHADANPYTRELVLFHPGSTEARLIHDVVRDVMRPRDPLRPTLTSAHDLCRALEDVKARLAH